MCLRSVYVHLFMFFLIYFWPHWTFISLEGFPCLWAEGYCPLAVRGFLVAGASLIAECGLSSCGTTGLVALRHVGSSRARDRTHVPCIGRQILYHCATREVPDLCFPLMTARPLSLLIPGGSICGCAVVQYRSPEQSRDRIGSVSFNAGCKMHSLLF